MAVVTWPLSSGEARGRVGDLVYNTWRGRSYVKQHNKIQDGHSETQQTIQAVCAQATAAWQAYGDVDRAAWNSFAAAHPLASWTGQPKRISGYNWFVRCRFNQIWGIGYTTDIPPWGVPDLILKDPYLEAYNLNIDLYWTPQTTELDLLWWVNAWLEGPHSGAVTPSIKRAANAIWTSEATPPAPLAVPEAGYYTVHFRPVHLSGRPSIFQHLTIYCPLE